jgi:hypothetical protein
MLFMVIERFRECDPLPVRARFQERGRMLPERVIYHASWIDAARARCFRSWKLRTRWRFSRGSMRGPTSWTSRLFRFSRPQIIGRASKMSGADRDERQYVPARHALVASQASVFSLEVTEGRLPLGGSGVAAHFDRERWLLRTDSCRSGRRDAAAVQRTREVA